MLSRAEEKEAGFERRRKESVLKTPQTSRKKKVVNLGGTAVNDD